LLILLEEWQPWQWSWVYVCWFIRACQRQLKQALADAQETIPNQLKQPTATPTLRWVFQCFQAIHLVHLNFQPQVSNLTDLRLWILRFFGSACQKYYLIC
jgi:hypothetical protein